MKVELIHYTGMGHPDADFAARLLIYTKNTRLTQGIETRVKIGNMPKEELAKELDYISKSIRSSWEFVDYTFEITGVTRAFTHQFVRTRTGSYAQQSQRSVDMEGFTCEMPASVAGDKHAESQWREIVNILKVGYAGLKAYGIPAQDCRGLLPTNVHTNIIAKFNLRTVADLVGKRENLRAQGEYAEVAKEMATQVLCVHPWAEPFLHPVRTRTPALDALLAQILGQNSPVDMPALNAALKELDMLKGTWG